MIRDVQNRLIWRITLARWHGSQPSVIGDPSLGKVIEYYRA